MLPFDPVTVGSLMLLAAGGGLQCELPKGTAINVTPKTLDVRYDYSESLSQIQKVKSDTIDPHGFGGISITQGFMRGVIKMVPKIHMSYKSSQAQGIGCVWYDKIDVVIEIDPTIVIANEVYQDRCMHKAVREHELKHVKVDRQIVNKYAKIIGKKLYQELNNRGFISGIIPLSSMHNVKQRMQDTVYQVVKHEYRKMELERIDLQRAVDSKEEYERVSAKCPEFKAKQKAIIKKF